MKLDKVILKAQKQAGHDRLEDIVAMGFDRDAIYTSLSYKLHLTGNQRYRAHFGKMKTQREVERAIAKLEEVREEMGNVLAKKEKKATNIKNEAEKQAYIKEKKASAKGVYLTSEQKRVAMRKLRKLNSMNPILKWLWLKYKKYL